MASFVSSDYKRVLYGQVTCASGGLFHLLSQQTICSNMKAPSSPVLWSLPGLSITGLTLVKILEELYVMPKTGLLQRLAPPCVNSMPIRTEDHSLAINNDSFSSMNYVTEEKVA